MYEKARNCFERKAAPHALHPTTKVQGNNKTASAYQPHLGSDGHWCAVRTIHWSPLGEGAPKILLCLYTLLVSLSPPVTPN